VRAEAWAGSEEDARFIADKANVFLTLFHAPGVRWDLLEPMLT
jgi:hypothetical protein